MAEAIELLRSKQQPDDAWLLESTHPGQLLFTLEAAPAFYVEAFGWRFDDYGPAYAGIPHQTAGPRWAASAPRRRRTSVESSRVQPSWLVVGHYGVDYVGQLGWHR